MQRTVLLDKKGLTLVEVMIALLVFLLVSLAMMQTALMSIEANTANVLRDEAVSVADMRLTQARTLAATKTGFDDPQLACPSETTQNITRPVRNIAGGATFSTTRSIPACIDGDTKQITIRVDWHWKGTDDAHKYTHSITSIVRRPS